MKLTIKTTKMQEMVSRSIKGAGNNKLIPLTSLMAIELKDGMLTLITTDAMNYLYIRDTGIDGEDFYVAVGVDTFARLISKMSSETISLELQNNLLKVRGNGEYSIELPLDESGMLIRYPDPLSTFEPKDHSILNLTTVDALLTSVKPALATTLENPCYTGYYAGEKVVATDTYKIASMNISMFAEPKLLSADTVNLLATMTSEKIDVELPGDDSGTIVFSSPDCVVYGVLMPELEDFAIDAISNLIATEYDSMCKLSKSALLQVLDRLSLFVNVYDKNGIYLTFTNDSLQISSKSATGIESISYVESKNHVDFTCCIDIEMLNAQVKAQTSSVVELYYGLSNAIKMVDGNITHIISLFDGE